uniref:Uncharacterized protein n=1 Tax=Esox lucius TaxID=8010 RepID=A0A3P8YSE7_ESOLU
MTTNGATHANASQWFSSNIFIIFVVVLILILLVIGLACWLIRRSRNRTNATEKVTEIEILSAGSGSETDTQPKFTLKIKTDQSHATQLVEMFVRRVSHAEGAGPAPAVTPPAVFNIEDTWCHTLIS